MGEKWKRVGACRPNPTQTELKKLDAVRKLVHFVRQEKPNFESRIVSRHLTSVIVVRLRKSNLRIAAQSGAFYFSEMVPTSKRFEKGQGSVTQTLEVTPEAKICILKELDHLGINASTV